MRLHDKIAVITGAGSGIGRAMAILFAKEGAKVVVVDIDAATGKETVDKIRASNGEAVFMQADVSVANEMQGVIRGAVQIFGRIDIFCSNAGIVQRGKSVDKIEESEWDRIFSVNVKGVYLAAKYVVPEMTKTGGGVLVNTASIAGVRARPFQAAYCSSKAACIMLTKALALELARYHIRVNCINPVATDTPMFPKLVPEGVDLNEAIQSTIKTIPLRRLAQPEDVAYAALYLASDEASMLTGSSVDVDGGRGI